MAMNKGYRQLLADRAARYRLTDAQKSYLKLLLNEAFAKGMPGGTGLDPHHLENTPRKSASFAINRLLECKKNNWQPLIANDEFWFWRGFKE